VMMIAITPSLNASSLLLSIALSPQAGPAYIRSADITSAIQL
jgi:hypothetical protein